MARKSIEFNRDTVKFNVDTELKRGCLKEKPYDTAKSDYPTFVAIDEYEKMLGKSVYNFTLAERDELMMMKFKNTTIGAVNSTASKIKGYIDYCVRQKDKNGNPVVPHNQNIFDTLIKSEAIKFVSKQATEFRYITRERLKEYQSMLKNWQDKAFLELVYNGVRGRTIKGGTMEELINLQIDPKSEDVKNCILTLVRNDGTERDIQVSQDTMNLVLLTYNSEEYLPNNGVDNKQVSSKRRGANSYTIHRYKNYVFRSLGNSKFGTLNPITINARFHKIQEYCNNNYITVYNLYMSGMITRAIEIYEQNGEITSEDYLRICKDYKYGDSPEKYFSKVKYEVESYLKGSVQDA